MLVKKIGSIIGIFSVTLFLSCSQQDSEKIYVFETKFDNIKDLELIDSVMLPIDTTTKAFSHVIQFFEAGSETYLGILNQLTNSVRIYDLAKRDLYKVIEFEIDGPNGVGEIEGFKIHNWDTILINSRYKLFFTDTTARPFFRFDFLKENSSGFESGILMNEARRQAIIAGNQLFIDISPDVDFTVIKDVRKARLKNILDLKTKRVRTDLGFTENYFKGIYPIQYIGLTSSTYNSQSNKFIYSLPAYANLIETDHNGYYKEYYAGSECCNNIPYLNNNNPSKKEYHQHYFTSPFFDAVIYDPFRKLYYRILLKGMSIEKFNERDWRRGFVVIIIDESFKKIGEVEFDISSGLSNGMYYVSEEGLNLFKASPNEGELMFYTFLPKDRNE